MGYPTKVQIIKRTGSEQWYVNFPAVLAKTMEFEKGETVEWIVEDKGLLVLRRMKVPGSAVKKKLLTTSLNNSKDSSKKGATPSPGIASSAMPKDSR